MQVSGWGSQADFKCNIEQYSSGSLNRDENLQRNLFTVDHVVHVYMNKKDEPREQSAKTGREPVLTNLQTSFHLLNFSNEQSVIIL